MIPRPPGARAGGEPPWAGVQFGPEALTVKAVRAAMAGRDVAAVPPAAPAATLLLLFEGDRDAVHLVLIRRSQALPVHPGEIGLPGGRVHPGEGMVEAALRETAEEVGVPAEAVEVLGWLEPVVGRTTGSVALPVVGLLSGRPHLRPEPAEVEAVFEVSLADLVAEGVYHEELWDLPVTRPVHFFELPEVTVWGMTGRVLHRFLGLLLGPGRIPE